MVLVALCTTTGHTLNTACVVLGLASQPRGVKRLTPLGWRVLTHAETVCLVLGFVPYPISGRHACMHLQHPIYSAQPAVLGTRGGGGGGGEVPHHKLIFVQCDIQESNVTRVHKGTNGSDLA